MNIIDDNDISRKPYLQLEEIIEQYLPLLRTYEKDSGLTIEQAQEEAGSQAGDNYMSLVTRTKIIGQSGHGDIYRKNFMEKHFPLASVLTEHARTNELFSNESIAYNNILPNLGNFGPPCVLAGGDRIIMEDMRDYGFTVANRKELLNFEHASWTLKNVAKLHASSFSWKIREPSSFEAVTSKLREVPFPDDDKPALGMFIDLSMRAAIKHLQTIEPPTDELTDIIKFIERYEFQLFKKIQSLFNRPRARFNVITHGDLWINNLLFKYNENGNIVDMRFIDFQIMRVTSPAVDIHYFIYSSVSSEMIEDRYDDLIKIYHDALIREMKRCGLPIDATREFSMDWLRSQLDEYAIMGLFSAVGLVHAVLADDADVDNFQKFENKDLTEIAQNEDIILISPQKVVRIKSILTHFYRRYGNAMGRP